MQTMPYGQKLFNGIVADQGDETFLTKVRDSLKTIGQSFFDKPSKSYKFMDQNVRLTPELYEKLQVELGRNRKLMVEPLVNSSTWDIFSNDQKVYNLDILYKMVTKTTPAVKAKFEAENFNQLFKMSQEKAKKQN